MKKYYVTAESWGADSAPENWEEIAAEINGKIDSFCENCDDQDAVADYVGRLWEEYCTSKKESEVKEMFSVVYDGGDFCDSFKCSTLEEAKGAALDVLLNWEFDFLSRMPGDLCEWSEDDREEWDRMICECCVFVKDGDDGEIVWEPEDKDFEFVSWLPYEELTKTARK